jgi:1,2-diacylglycerol 3-alpha-glucosyltransferase
MKILIAGPTYYPDVNGASYAVQRLAFYLKKQGHQVMVLTASSNRHHDMRVHNGVPIYGIPSMPIERIRTPIPFIVRYWTQKAFQEFQPDVVHIASHFTPGRNVLSVAKKLGIPVVGTNHFMPENVTHYLHLPKAVEKQMKKLMWKFSLRTLEQVNVLTSPTRIAADLLVDVGMRNTVHVVSNGIDLEMFHASQKNVDVRARYGIPNDTPILLSVCRLDKEKNVDLILRAFKKASSSISAMLVIAGSGAEKENLKALTKDLALQNRVIFTGFVPDADLPDLYATSEVFIIAGTAELQCLVAMEAMASGVPVLAVRAMALPELVKDRESGMLFDHQDLQMMSDEMVEIFTDESLRKKLGAGAQAEIQKHNMHQVIRRFEEMYASVINTTATD